MLGITYIAALIVMPENVVPAGALRLSGSLLAIGLALPTLIQLGRYPASAFHPVNVVAAAPIYWLLLDLIQGSYDLKRVSSVDAMWAFTCIALFSTGVFSGSAVRPMRVPPLLSAAVRIHLSEKKLFGLCVLVFALAFLRFAIPSRFDLYVIFGAFRGGRWQTPWSRGFLGGWDSFLDHFAYFGYILPALTVLIARRAGWLNPRTVMALTLTGLITALMSISGGRRIIGVMGGSALCVWFLSGSSVRWRHLAVVIGFSSILLFAMQVILIFRDRGLSEVFSKNASERLMERKTLHIDDNFLRLAQITKIIPEQHPYVTWRWALWVAVRPIPRVFWAGKPVDPGFNLTTHLGIQGVSLSMSIIGELYMAFGFVGCALGGILFGRLSRSLANVLESSNSSGALIVFGVGLLALFTGIRSGIELVLMSYGLVAWVVSVAIYSEVFGAGRAANVRMPPIPRAIPKYRSLAD